MKTGKRIGWITLGLTPIAAGFCWQILVSVVGVVIYMFYGSYKAAETGTAVVDYDQLIAGFLDGNGGAYGLMMATINIGYLLIFGLWYGLMFVRKQQDRGRWKQVLKPVRISGLLVCGLGVQLFLSMALTVIFSFAPALGEQYKLVSDALISNSVFMILCVCILAPIGEELIFRGLTMRIMEKAIPWQAAMIIQAILFGIYHMNLIQGIYAALLGLIFGYVAHRYGSVIPGMLLHMAVNSFSYGMQYLLPEEVEESILWQVVLCVVGLGMTIAALRMYLKDVKSQN